MLMELSFPLLLLSHASDALSPAALLIRAQHHRPIVFPSRAFAPSTTQSSPLGLIPTQRGFDVSGGEIVVLLLSRRYFVVGSQPQLLERLGATAAGCCCLGVPELIIEEAHVRSVIHPSTAGGPGGRVDGSLVEG